MDYALLSQLAMMDAAADNRQTFAPAQPPQQPAAPQMGMPQPQAPMVAQNPMDAFLSSRRRMFGDPAQGSLGPMRSPVGRVDIPSPVPFRKSGPINAGGDRLVG